MNIKQKGHAVFVAVLVILVVAAIAFVGWKVFLQDDKKTSDNGPKQPTQITNFEECAAAGNPIMESYPEQCRADGKTYTKEIKQ